MMSLVGLSTKTATVVNLAQSIEWRNPEYVRACSPLARPPPAFVQRAPGAGPRAFLVCPPSGPPNLAVCEGALAEDVDVARRIEEAAVVARANRVQQPPELVLVDGEGNRRFSPSIWSGAMTAPDSEAGVLSLAVSHAAHSAVIHALMTASSLADLQAGGYDLSADGWLTLPRGTEGNVERPAPGRAGSGSPGSPRAQARMAGIGIGAPTNVPSVRVHIPSFLRAQHAAFSDNRPPPEDGASRAAQRHGAGGVEGAPPGAAPLVGDGATEYERMRAILVTEDLELTSVAQNARVVAACAMSHLLLTIFRLMTSDFVAAVGALSIAGYLGARYGNHAGLSLYLLYVVMSVGFAIYAVSMWAADGVLGGTAPTFITAITGRWGAVIVLATTCISIVACAVTARLLYALLRLHWAGWDASERAFLLENPSMALLNRTTRRVAMGTTGVAMARPNPLWTLLFSSEEEAGAGAREGTAGRSTQPAAPTGARRGGAQSRGTETEDTSSRVAVTVPSPLRGTGATRRTGGITAGRPPQGVAGGAPSAPAAPHDAGGPWQPPVRPTVPLGRAMAHPNSRSREPVRGPLQAWTRPGGGGRNTSAAAEGAGNVTFTAALAMML